MSIESISSINCNARNDYDKKFCTGLNPDKIDNFLKPYQIEPFNYFDKNIFSLHDEKEVIADLSKEKCSTHTINNNYGGFHFKGDKNKCLLFNSNNFDKNNENKFKNYNIKTFIKTKDTIDFENNKDQLDSSKYLTEINNKDYLSDGIIKEIDVSNETECFDKCIRNYGDCKSLIYMKQPELCTFYNDKKMDIQPNKNKDYDTYTTKKNKLKAQKNIINNLFRDQNNLDDEYYYCSLNNDNCVLDYSFNQNKEEDKDQLDRTDRPDISIYNCSGLESTNPFCTKIYNENDYKLEENIDNSLNYTNCIKIDNINNQNKLFNKECKKKYGYEYVFDNDKIMSFFEIFGGKEIKVPEYENLRTALLSAAYFYYSKIEGYSDSHICLSLKLKAKERREIKESVDEWFSSLSGEDKDIFLNASGIKEVL